jgi:hypothetical protein
MLEKRMDGPRLAATSGAMARWKWRRKQLKRLAPAMEMARSADVDEGTTGIDATKGLTASAPPERDTLKSLEIIGEPAVSCAC